MGESSASMTPMTLVQQESAVIKELIEEGHATSSVRVNACSSKVGAYAVVCIFLVCAICCVCLGAFDLLRFLMGLGVGAVMVQSLGIKSRTKLQSQLEAATSNYQELALKERASADFSAAWACSLDDDGRIIAMNDASFRMSGFEALEMRGKLFAATVAEVEVAKALAALQTARNENCAEAVLTMRTNNNRLLHVEWSIEFSRSTGGFFCIGHDVTARRELEQLRQEFLEMIAHDLKAPLSNIVLASQMLQSSEELDADARKKRLRTIETRAQRLVLLVSELLDIDKFEAGSLQLHFDQCEVDSVIDSSVDMIEQLAAAKKIKITRDVSVSHVVADKQRLLQVLINLLSNAIKFSKSGSTVDLLVDQTTEGVRFCIIDHGRGISDSDCAKIFDRFAQMELSESALKGGTGLGLAISKSLVEAHGGRIRVESEPGIGSKFSFVIPNAVTPACKLT